MTTRDPFRDAIAEYGASTLQRLMREGSYTLSASTIHPSKTLPSHTSMLTGQPPERHGVLWNNVASAEASTVDVPNIFGVARAHGYRTAAFFSKAKFQPLQVQGTLDYSQAPGGLFGRWSSERTVADVASYLDTARPNVLFVHLTDPDAAGHSAGWMTPAYGRAVARGGPGRQPVDRTGRQGLWRRQLHADRHGRSRRAWHEPRQRRPTRCHDSVDRVGPWREARRADVVRGPDHGHRGDGALAACGRLSPRTGPASRWSAPTNPRRRRRLRASRSARNFQERTKRVRCAVDHQVVVQRNASR